jgi:hypothetical protein
MLFGETVAVYCENHTVRPSYPHSHTYHSGCRVYKLFNDWCWAPMKINFIINNLAGVEDGYGSTR